MNIYKQISNAYQKSPTFITVDIVVFYMATLESSQPTCRDVTRFVLISKNWKRNAKESTIFSPRNPALNRFRRKRFVVDVNRTTVPETRHTENRVVLSMYPTLIKCWFEYRIEKMYKRTINVNKCIINYICVYRARASLLCSASTHSASVKKYVPAVYHGGSRK